MRFAFISRRNISWESIHLFAVNYYTENDSENSINFENVLVQPGSPNKNKDATSITVNVKGSLNGMDNGGGIATEAI